MSIRASWIALNAGLTTPYVQALAVDPQTPTTIYAGTNGGIFKSTDGVVDVGQFDRHSVDAVRRQVPRLGGRVPEHRAHHAFHQQHRAAIGMNLDQLGHEVGIHGVRRGVEHDLDRTGHLELLL